MNTMEPTITTTPDPTISRRLCKCEGPITLNRVDGTPNTWRCGECDQTVRLDLHGFEVKS